MADGNLEMKMNGKPEKDITSKTHQLVFLFFWGGFFHIHLSTPSSDFKKLLAMHYL